MALLDQIKGDVKEALKARNALRAETLRGLVSSLNNEEIACRSNSKEFTDEVALKVLQGEAKKRKEAIEVYSGAGREELAEKEKEELKIIEGYLPAELTEEEVSEIVKKVIETTGGDNFGAVMGAVMKEVSGRADSQLVTKVVKEQISS